MRLPDRWIPVVAATVGVLGGMGGALVGGYISIQGQEDRAQDEREAVQREVRRETYATYIQAVEGFLQNAAAVGDFKTRAEEAAFIKAEGIPVLTALAVVDLVADDEVQDAAHAITDALESEDGIASDEEWESLKENFIDLAQKDILPSE